MPPGTEPNRKTVRCAQPRGLRTAARADSNCASRVATASVARSTAFASAPGSCIPARAVSRALGGSCSMPLAAHAVWDGQRLRVDAALGDAADLTRPLLRCSSSAHVAGDAEAVALGERCVAQLHALGAEGYLAAAHGG